MEATKLKTLEDLLCDPRERVELIDGEIVKRPMARSEHALVQSHTVVELGPFDRIIWPEDRALIAYQPDQGVFKVAATIQGQARARVPPFDEAELDLAYILGD